MCVSQKLSFSRVSWRKKMTECFSPLLLIVADPLFQSWFVFFDLMGVSKTSKVRV